MHCVGNLGFVFPLFLVKQFPTLPRANSRVPPAKMLYVFLLVSKYSLPSYSLLVLHKLRCAFESPGILLSGDFDSMVWGGPEHLLFSVSFSYRGCPDVCSHITLRSKYPGCNQSSANRDQRAHPPCLPMSTELCGSQPAPRKTPDLPAPDHSPVPGSICCRHLLCCRFSAQPLLRGEGLVPE